jgi:hypothetical protein
MPVWVTRSPLTAVASAWERLMTGYRPCPSLRAGRYR